MSYVVINAITVPAAQADELAARFAGRAGMVEKADGFEQFDLLRPADGNERWLVMTRWRDEDAFKAWMSSAAFGEGHRQAAAASAAAGSPSPSASGSPAASASPSPAASPHASASPVASASEIWSFSVEQHVVR